ncbi:hypothetical protein GUJ93_ZPchr0002g24576 [Zizania palustris]|uniref:Uncharacterized protein n=1 Tax=Zizania palustris TaxID=103762 RepID=A0A8J5V4D1_ZIZPA|nr:hypothetical protein GUJ93_ZPchr0002g24576 [Zizania palustris]
MDQEVSFDAASVYPITLPSPRMVGARDQQSPEKPSGFRKSINPIYGADDTGSRSAMTLGAERSDVSVDNNDGAGAVPLLVRRHAGGGAGDGRWEAIERARVPAQPRPLPAAAAARLRRHR